LWRDALFFIRNTCPALTLTGVCQYDDRMKTNTWRGIFSVLTCTLIFGMSPGEARANSSDNVARWTGEAPATTEVTAAAQSTANPAAALMAEALDRLPTVPISMKGRLTMRRPRGFASKEFDFHVMANWAVDPPVIQYAVYDLKGNLLEQVAAQGGVNPQLMRVTGPQLAPAPAPAWNERIQGSDVTWLDVSLGFLWWKNPRLVGEEKVKGRLCDIVEVDPPLPIPGCDRVRIFLDRELKVLMRAEELNTVGQTTRRMWVRSVKRMQDDSGEERWMVRDLEVETHGSGHRTRLHINEVSEAGE